MSEELSDIPRARVEQGMRDKGLPVADLGMLLGTARGLFTATPGFSKGFDLTFLVLGMIKADPPWMRLNRVAAWMPIELAPTPEKAQKLLYEMVWDATLQSFDEYEIEDEVVLPEGRERRLDKYRGSHRFAMRGPGCADEARCHLSTILYHPGPWSALPDKGKAPDWMGGYPAWVFTKSAGTNLLHFTMPGGAPSGDSRAYAAQLSKRLPTWAIVTVAPTKPYKRAGAQHGGYPLPLVYRDGKAHAPVFPEIDLNQTAGPSGSAASARSAPQPAAPSTAVPQSTGDQK